MFRGKPLPIFMSIGIWFVVSLIGTAIHRAAWGDIDSSSYFTGLIVAIVAIGIVEGYREYREY